jgi:protein SCO1/2
MATAAIVSGCGAGGARSTTSSTPETGSGLAGAALPGGTPAPSFALRDVHGSPVSLGEYRGRVVVLAFLYSTCGRTCTVIAQQIRGALDELEEAHARAPAVVIVSADPAADTQANVTRFLHEVSLSGRAVYLTGSLGELERVWRAYRVRPASAGGATFAEYASVIVVDAKGDERALFQSEQLTPEGISDDVEKLAGDPTGP